MKNLILGTALLLSSVNTFAKEKCYEALNPQNIKITKINETSKVSEFAKSAQVMLENETVESYSYGAKFNTPPNIMLKAQSKSFIFRTTATQIEAGSENFGVDCDGGQVVVKVVGGILVLNTEYLAGDIKTASEGCASGSVTFKNLALIEKKSCASKE